MISLIKAAEEEGDISHYINKEEGYQVRVKTHKTKIGNFQVLYIDRGTLYEDDKPFSWEDLQQIKDRICGLGHQGIEVYPHNIGDEPLGNGRVLWVFPKGKNLPLNFYDVFSLDELS